MKALLKKLGPVCAVIGGQWGDEGKGKLVDILSGRYDIIMRATGGANAGHTIYFGSKKFVFHLIPAGMLHPKTLCIMGNGMVVHLPTLMEEMDVLEKEGVKIGKRLQLSDRAHLVFEYHKIIDRLQEEMKGSDKVGTTGRGIGPAYSDKTSRLGIRVCELNDVEQFEAHYRQNLKFLKKLYDFSFDGEAELKQVKKFLPRIKSLIADSVLLLHDSLDGKKKVLIEGANGTLLDIDHGTFPFVTSSNASIGGIISGSGLPPSRLTGSAGIMKAYVTRVGSGPFPTELDDELGEKIRTKGAEFGATTGRPRRCGWFDAVAASYSIRLNGLTAINLTKIDVLTGIPKLKIGYAYIFKNRKITEFPSDTKILEQCSVEYMTLKGWKEDISKCRNFAQLPAECKKYIATLEKLIGCPIACIGTGPGRDEMIFR